MIRPRRLRAALSSSACGACLAVALLLSVCWAGAGAAQEPPTDRYNNELLRRLILGLRRCEIRHYDLRVTVPNGEPDTTAQVACDVQVAGFARGKSVETLPFLILKTARIQTARVAGAPAPFTQRTISSEYPVSIVEVELPKPLEPGQELTLSFEYALPSFEVGNDGKRNRRPTDPFFGKDEFFTNLASAWFPGNVYARFSFVLDVTAPAGFQVLASGAPDGETVAPDGRVTFRFRETGGINVITFFGARFRVHTIADGDRTLALYTLPIAQPLDAARILEDMRWCLHFFEQRFGPSGLKRFAIGMGTPNYGGASYNALHYAIVRANYFQTHDRGGDAGGALWFGALAHEISHIWWGFRAQSELLGHGGNWLREGLAEYSSFLALEARYGASLSPHYCHRKMLRNYHNAIEELGAREPSLIDITYAMPEDTNYEKGAWLFRMLERLIGPEALARVLERYLAAAGSKMATWKVFRKIADDESGRDLSAFFEQWLVGTDHLDLEVTVSPDPWRVVVTQAKGAFQPASSPTFRVVVVGEDGAEQVSTLDLPGSGGRKEIALAGRPKKVVVDPDGVLLDVNRLNNCWPEGWSPGLSTVFLPAAKTAGLLGVVTDQPALLIHSVAAGSPGARLQLKGTLIGAIDGRAIQDPDALEARCWNLCRGEEIELTLRARNGSTQVRLRAADPEQK